MSPARLVIVACISLVLCLPSAVLAQADSNTTPPTAQQLLNSGVQQAGAVIGQELNSSNYKAPQNSDYAMINMMHAAICQIAGTAPDGNCLANTVDSNGNVKVLSYARIPGGGVAGGLAMIMASLYERPTSSSEYVADIGRNVGLVKSAYAQNVLESSGGQVIKPVLSLWRFTQQVAFVGFVLIFLVVGFMIMLRRKMNPQTVVSVQSALPGLVVGLIMVTFSYFIAAFIIDTSFLGMQVVAGIFSQQANVFGKTTQDKFNLDTNKQNLDNLAKSSNIFDFLGFTVERFDWGRGSDSQTIQNAVDKIVDPNIPGGKVGSIAIGTIAALLIALPLSLGGAAIPAAAGGAAGLNIGTIVGLLIPLIFIVALTIQLFRLVFALIGAYIQLLIGTIFGPFYILASSVPGQGKLLTNWMKGLLANALIFPAVFAVFLFAGAILAVAGNMWGTPPPLFGGLPTELIPILVAYGILLASPSIPDAVKGALGIKGQDNLGKAAAAGFLGGYGFGATAVSGGYKRYWRGGAKEGESPKGIIPTIFTSSRNTALRNIPRDPNNPNDPNHILAGRLPRVGTGDAT